MTEAILLVGGFGTRLKPLTIHTPKPMLEVAGYPVTAHQISKAKAAGINHIVLGTAFKAEVFREGLTDGSKLGVKISYAYEPVQLGTGGGIRNAAELLTCGPEDPVVVFNGDVLTGVDIIKVLQVWKEKKADVAIYLTKVDNPAAYGSVPTDEEGNVLAFLEKPERKEDIVTDQINAGMYVFKRKIIDTIATGRVVSVEREVFPDLLKAGLKVIGVVDQSYWLDLGTPKAFVQGSSDLVLGNIKTGLLNSFGDKLVLAGAKVSPTAQISLGSVIGKNSNIEDDCEIINSVILNEVTVGKKSVIESSIIARGAKIGEGCVIKNSVVADFVELAAGSVLINDSRIWPDQKVAKIELNNQTIPTNPDWGN